jgi:hypothetical protein
MTPQASDPYLGIDSYHRASDSSRLASDPYLGIDSYPLASDSSLGFEVVASFESIDALVAAA